MDYDYDLFISYSREDNKASGNWVRQFSDKLSDLFRMGSGRKLTVFLDEKDLNTGNLLSERLKDALGKSALFIPILSPSYLASAWCRREFLHFVETAGDRLFIDRSCRILPLRLIPFDRFEAEEREHQDEVKRIADFLPEILYKDFYRDPLPIPPEDAEFSGKIATLSKDVDTLLKAAKDRFREKPVGQPAGASALFLGYAAKGSEALRDSLLKELLQQRKYGKIPHRILPDEAPDVPGNPKSLSVAGLEEFLRRQLEESTFSIHLFDDSEGPKVADTQDRIPHLQYRIAKEIAAQRADFRMFTSESTTEELGTLQEDFLRSVAEDARQIPQIEALPAFELKAIKDFLLEKIALAGEKAAREAEAPAEGGRHRVFLVHDHRDKGDPMLERIDDLIFGKQYDVLWPLFREDGPYKDPDIAFRDTWLLCERAIILLRSASTAWCNAIKVELIKTATDKKVPYAMAICVTEPDAARRIREVRSHEFMIIDCAQEGYERQIVQFLNAARHA